MSFDRIAPFYGPLENLLAGKCMHHTRSWLLEGSHQPEKVLMVGEGPGRFLELFRRRFPQTEVTVVDGSARMLDIARRRLKDPRGVTFVHSRIEEWEASQAFDLVVTNFLLDCLPQSEMEATVEKISKWASPQAEWWIAEFNMPDRGAAKWRSRVILRLLYTMFGLVAGVRARQLHPPDDVLRRMGFHRAARKTWSWNLLKGERWNRIQQ